MTASKQWFITVCVASAMLLMGADGWTQTRPAQEALTEKLRGGDRTEQYRAARAAIDLGRDATPELRSALVAVLEAENEARARRAANPQLRAALITTLGRESALHSERRRAARRGETLEPITDDLYGSVAQAVVELRDPAAIPALASALGTGMMVIRALVAARRHLTGRQPDVTLWNAIDLTGKSHPCVNNATRLPRNLGTTPKRPLRNVSSSPAPPVSSARIWSRCWPRAGTRSARWSARRAM